MSTLFIGILAWILLAVAAWRYATIRPTLHPYDRIGAGIFFMVIGLPLFTAGLALIAQSLRA
jgi:hypothetical protein